MASAVNQRLTELVDAAAKEIRRKVGRKGKSDQVEDFCRRFYANVPPGDLRGVAAADVAGAALSLWQTMQQRLAGEVRIRVFNPREARDGWHSPHTIVEIVNDDMPFLVDSTTTALNGLGAEVLLVIHPIMLVRRSAKGRLAEIVDEKRASGAIGESVMHLQISERQEEEHEAIVAELSRVLADVRCSVEDWPAMREQCRAVIADLEDNPPKVAHAEIAEASAFLKWMDDDHFTYLGYREYRFEGRGAKAYSKIDPRSGLGILRDPGFRVFEGLRNLGKLPPDVRAFVKAPTLVRTTKANRRSTVHRRTHMDTVAVKLFDDGGKVVGERLFIGLFTSVAYSRSPREIPILREKVASVLRRSGFRPGSHDGKALMHILEHYPRDELFEISDSDLGEIAMGVLHLQERQRTSLFLRLDPFGRFVSCMIYVPRDRYDNSLRRRLTAILEETYEGAVDHYSTRLTDAALAQVHVIIKTRDERIPEVAHETVEAALTEAARSWADHMEEALVTAHGEEVGLRSFRRFERAFPASYQEAVKPGEVLVDVACLEEALDRSGLALNLYDPGPESDDILFFRLYIAGSPVPLSDVLPMLENMGLKVMGEVPFQITPLGHDGSVWIHDFEMRSLQAGVIDLPQVRDLFHDAFRAVWTGAAENDGFNRLVLYAGLSARQVTMLRAYCKYLRQARIPFSQRYMERTLADNPEITRYLVDLFEARFDPAKAKGSDKRIGVIKNAINQLLDDVSNLDEDRIIRRYLNIIEATIRTNFYQPGEDGEIKGHASFKFDCQLIDELPRPRPFREIFVYSPRVEGVHLRFGMVARGGLRWSDRREDFRTEILGLVKAQQVKNAVIVPVGSKGGFVLKNPPPPEAGRDAFQAEGIACYKIFIRALLDVTDNLKGPKVVPPQSVQRYDGDDPYLVVAADKGTATFSDIANGVSIEYGHWLDDAFASGGSAGYDHKKMGITAKGAWEGVKRHFREIGKDIQNEDFTCVGCGDMAGDVFGNGMLLSKHIKLVGAFNHMHIFIDPTPDSARSWRERKRLFDLPRSAWTDYNAKLISKGGGIFDRKAKAIKLSPEVKALFAIDVDSVTPNELIKAMLKAEVELLWFGGIGTYVKAREETDADVGDRANDALRIDGREVGGKVVGEGANLGMTQRGRIEFCQAGGRGNTDSIDNSAGVDCSDHEVNIKILLGAVEEAGGLKRAQRDKLLERMTDEVGEQCLRDNYLQTQSITVTHDLGAHLLDRFARFMRALEKNRQLDRAIEFLPDDEVINERMKQGIGLARPEVAVLLSYSKIVLYDEILASSLPDDPYFLDDLIEYFPSALRKKYATEISKHRLRREIVATVVTNDLVNRVGINFIYEVREKTGLSAAEITKAYTITREIFGMRQIWAEIEALDNKAPAMLQSTMLVECGRLIERETVWFLREGGAPLRIDKMVADYGPGVRVVMDRIETFLGASDQKLMAERTQGYMEQGASRALARRIASLQHLAPACDIVRIAQQGKLPVEQAAELYFAIGERFGLHWLRRAAGQLPSDTAWDKLAVTAVVDDLFGHQADLTGGMLSQQAKGKSKGKPKGKKDSAQALIEGWSAQRTPLVARNDQLLAELKSAGTPDFAMLAVANRQLKSMVGG